ncbi:LacI family DNA-binding transcriptional regulator [Limimaricola sp. AA108-03]|uniref:LacI family DNA-binding transcriptional regulator n=1 Tax=Limimaricola sp. AA108-03 TaxID=3425945 RepID=UPI003D770178
MAEKIGRIRDVAKESGLSIATVSRVMNGYKGVREATREKVLRACERLDYVPNSAARALSTSRTRTVAAIIPTIENSVYAKFVAAIEQTLSEQGYTLLLAVSHGSEAEEIEAARKLLAMGADAFILSGAAHDRALLDMLARRKVPHVFTSIWAGPEGPVPCIGYDNHEIARSAVGYLAERGHRHLGVIHGPLADNDRAVARKAGVVAMRAQGLELCFEETELSVAGGKSATARLLDRDPDLTALLCFSDVLALGAYFALAERGRRVPDDMAVMGFDNLDWTSETVPPLTTIDLPAGMMGREVAGQIVEHLEHRTPLAPVLLPSRIVERGSVGPGPGGIS